MPSSIVAPASAWIPNASSSRVSAPLVRYAVTGPIVTVGKRCTAAPEKLRLRIGVSVTLAFRIGPLALTLALSVCAKTLMSKLVRLTVSPPPLSVMPPLWSIVPVNRALAIGLVIGKSIAPLACVAGVTSPSVRPRPAGAGAVRVVAVAASSVNAVAPWD